MLERVEVRSHYIGGLMLTTNATPGALEPVITKILADLDPNLTISSVRTMREQVALRFDQDRAVASLAGLFGGVALLLAAVGLYGVTAYGVAQRRNEIGIRMALGADRGKVVGLVLRGTAARVGAGLALGMPLAIGGRAASSGAVVRREHLGSRGAGNSGRSAGAVRVRRGDNSGAPGGIDSGGRGVAG